MKPLELHPEFDGKRFTLRGIFRDEAQAAKKLDQLRKQNLDAHSFSQTSPKGNDLHFIVARHDGPPQYRAGMPHEKSTDWVATAYAIRVFRLLIQASRKGRRVVRGYKRLDLEALRKTIARYRLQGRLVDAAGNILSSTILAHPFPNANHRTSLSLCRVYLEFMGVGWPGYTLRGQGQKRLHAATHAFFRESKYLLQLLRHSGLVRIADEEGFTHLHIGPDTDTEIVGADLHLSPQAIRERHEALCRRTIKEVATEAVRPQLETKADRSLKQWVDWLKKTD